MPAPSGKAYRFFQGCKHNPKHMRGKCPSHKVAREFVEATPKTDRSRWSPTGGPTKLSGQARRIG